MTAPILYGFIPTSPIPTRTRHVRATWLANELGIPLQFENVDISAGEQKSPAFLAMNPLGQVPVLKDGDVVLTESCAIALYLAEKHADKGLYPSTLRGRAQLNQLAFFVTSALEPTVFDMFISSEKFPFPGRADPQKYHDARKKLVGEVGPAVAALLGSPFALGEQFSVADVIVAYPLSFLDYLGELEHFPVVNEYYKRLAQRPAFKDAFAPAPTLYGFRNSGPVQNRTARCTWIAKELNVPLQFHSVDVFKQENKSPEFLAINPLGQVPVLKDRGFVLTESCAIASYFAETHVEKGLFPATVEGRARLAQTTGFVTSVLESLGLDLLKYSPESPFPEPWSQKDAEKYAAAKEKWLTQVGPATVKVLGNGAYALGDGFSVVDVILGYPLQFFDLFGNLEPFPALKQYYERLRQRPAYQACNPAAGFDAEKKEE